LPPHQLIISPAAKNDLKAIYQYGMRQWGRKQSDNYLMIIEEQLWSLIEQPIIGIERTELLVTARSLSIRSHTLFYRVAAKELEVIRILHNRQDPQQHLK